MNETQRKLKRLAEQNVLAGKALTYEQLRSIKGTKYADVVDQTRVASNFDILTEQFTKPSAPAKKHTFGDPAIDRSTIRALIDDIDERFDLDITSKAENKYGAADIDAVKQFIHNYALNEMMTPRTQAYLVELASRNDIDIYELMFALFTHAK